MHNRLPAVLLAALTSLGVGAAPAQAAYPDAPVSYVVPYPPGGTNDNVARILGKRLAEKTGQPFIIEYKAGAGGTIGAAHVAHAKPDGHTLLNTSIGNLAIAPQLLKASFDPFEDIAPVHYVGNALATVAVNPALPFRTLPELIAYARANPGKLTYGSSGTGTPGHLAGEFLKREAGIDIRHIPYKGSAPAVADAVAGHVDMAFDPLSTPQVQSGKLRALAFFGGDRAPNLPGVPHIRQAGLPNWEDALGGSFFVSVSSKAPADVQARLSALLADILREPETIAALESVQVSARPLPADDTRRIIRNVHDLAAQILDGKTKD